MKQDTKQLAIGFLACLALVVLACFIGIEVANAHNGPSRKDMAYLAGIKNNQQILTTDRTAYDRVMNATTNDWPFSASDVAAYDDFVKAKADNEYKANALFNDGWVVNWTTLQLVAATPKSTDSFQ